MTEHTHHHDEDSACDVAHSPVAAASSVPAERTLVAVFASPVAGYLLRYGADERVGDSYRDFEDAEGLVR